MYKVGEKIKFLTYLGPGKTEKSGIFKCVCGEINNYSLNVINSGHRGSCGCNKTTKFKYTDKYHQFNIILNKVKNRQYKHNIEITKEDLYDIYKQQNGKCYYTNEDLFLPEKYFADTNISVDRIDSSLGYTKNNIQLVLIEINFMKQSMSHDEFILFCKSIIT